MTPSVLVPWRDTDEHRRAALAWVTARYESLGWPVHLGECPSDEWVKAEAVASALADADGDLLIVSDADVWSDGIVESVAAVTEGRNRWAMPFGAVHRLTEAETAEVLAGAEPRASSAGKEGSPGGGIVVLSRGDYLHVPLDPCFAAWGQEDEAWGEALRVFLGPPFRSAAGLWHLWHPPQPDRRPYQGIGHVGSEENRLRWRAYTQACGLRRDTKGRRVRTSRRNWPELEDLLAPGRELVASLRVSEPG